TITPLNSLVGSGSGDDVGFVTPLSNGNYVVSSSSWNGGRGAASWGNGATGATGTVSAANSLVGTTPNSSIFSQNGDRVGSLVTALNNGNDVVSSPYWNGVRGATTWGSGTTGVHGTVSADNSLVGSSPGDQVGTFFVESLTTLPNGNYVVGSANIS